MGRDAIFAMDFSDISSPLGIAEIWRYTMVLQQFSLSLLHFMCVNQFTKDAAYSYSV